MRDAMLPYLAIFSSKFREQLQYRAAALAGIATQVVFGFIILMVLLAFYESSDVTPPLTTAQTLAYVWLGQALLGLLPWNVDPGVADSIRTGEVALDLLRPIDTYGLWFTRVLAWRIARTMLRCGPMVLLTVLVFPRVGMAEFVMPGPASWSAFGLFVVAVFLALLMSAAITVLMQVAMLWTVSPEGVLRLVPPFVIFLSGNLIPLPLLPDWMQPILMAQPLRGLLDTPFRIYGGNLTGGEAWTAMVLSIVWLGIMIIMGQWGMQKGMRRMVVAGG